MRPHLCLPCSHWMPWMSHLYTGRPVCAITTSALDAPHLGSDSSPLQHRPALCIRHSAPLQLTAGAGVVFSDDGALSGLVLYDPLRPAEYQVDFIAFSTVQWETAGLARLQVRAHPHILCCSVTHAQQRRNTHPVVCSSVTHAQQC